MRYNSSYIRYVLNKAFYSIVNYIKRKDRIFLSSERNCFWCKCTHRKSDLFCSNVCKNAYHYEKYQVFKHNNRCEDHVLQKLTYRNKCWSCFKEDAVSGKWPRMRKMFILRLNGFRAAPTFRTSKTGWNGDKIAFEQFLKDNRIKWFVYIKFYVNKKGKIRPLVVGKSGSLFVNGYGTDLSFSTHEDHGPARRFISYNKFEWYYDRIAIKRCKNQFHAYNIEKKMQEKFDLFGS